MLNPLIERRDYGKCDQIEKNLIALNDKGLLSGEMNKDRMNKCLSERVKQAVKEIINL